MQTLNWTLAFVGSADDDSPIPWHARTLAIATLSRTRPHLHCPETTDTEVKHTSRTHFVGRELAVLSLTRIKHTMQSELLRKLLASSERWALLIYLGSFAHFRPNIQLSTIPYYSQHIQRGPTGQRLALRDFDTYESSAIVPAFLSSCNANSARFPAAQEEVSIHGKSQIEVDKS